MAGVDPALEKQVLDVPEAERVPRIHHHHEADHLGRGVEVAEWARGLAGARHAGRVKLLILTLGAFGLTVPSALVRCSASGPRQ